MKWVLLILAILFEVAGTTMMKLSEGFTKPLYSIGIFISYIGSLTFLTLTLKFFEISIVYAVWSGVGIAVISIIGLIYFDEKIDMIKTISLILVILGVIGLNLTSKH
jgi:small multidrug resistance pump